MNDIQFIGKKPIMLELKDKKDTTKSPPPSNSLPREVFLMVLSILKPEELIACSQVDRYWYHMICDPNLWKPLTQKLQPDKKIDELGQTSKVEYFYKKHKICKAQNKALTQESETGKRNNVHMTDPTIAGRVLRFPMASTLTIEDPLTSSLPMNQNVTDAALSSIAAGLPLLRSIKIKATSPSAFPMITKTGIDNLTRSHPYLREITVTGCSGLDKTGLTSILNNCRKLKLICIDNDALENDHARQIAELNSLVSTLSLAGRCKLNDEGVELIVDKCKKLTNLDIRLNSHSFSESALQKIIGIGGLNSLILSGVEILTDKDIQTLANSSPDLEVLDLSDCSNLTPKSIEILAHGCKKLRSLFLKGESISFDPQFQELKKAGFFSRILNVKI